LGRHVDGRAGVVARLEDESGRPRGITWMLDRDELFEAGPNGALGKTDHRVRRQRADDIGSAIDAAGERSTEVEGTLRHDGVVSRDFDRDVDREWHALS